MNPDGPSELPDVESLAGCRGLVVGIVGGVVVWAAIIGLIWRVVFS